MYYTISSIIMYSSVVSERSHKENLYLETVAAQRIIERRSILSYDTYIEPMIKLCLFMM